MKKKGKELWRDKKLIVFDLDGTLTESKKELDIEMAQLLRKLLGKKTVAVIAGGLYHQFRKQFLPFLKSSEAELKNLFLFPASATSFYQRKNKSWKKIYEKRLSSPEKKKIKKAFVRAFGEIRYRHPSKTYGKIIEDRASQITFSALGQKALLEGKREWNKISDQRPKIKATLDRLLPKFEIRLGGLTSIDVTRKGIDKAYGIRQIMKYLRVKKEDVLFVGDALYKGGNDFPVKKTGVETLQILGPDETKHFIRFIL